MIAGVFVLIGVPLVAAAVTFIFRRLQTLVALVAAAVAAVLGAGALWLPLGQVVQVGGRQVALGEPAQVIGRQLMLTGGDRQALGWMFLVSAALFLIGGRARSGTAFFSLGLAILGLVSAALVVQPFLYSALLLTMAAILAALLVQGGTPGRARGAFRYLVLMTLALPMFLVAGWLVDLHAINPTDIGLARSVVLVLTGGFALLLGVVPFHIWIGPMAEESPPVASVFVLAVVNSAVWFMLFDILQAYPWLAAQPDIFQAMQLVGLLTAAVGGVLAFSSYDFAHVLGYGALADYGCALVVLSTRTSAGLGVVMLATLMRPVGLSILALGMALARERAHSSEFEKLSGLAWSSPWTAMALIVGGFSVAGLPPLAGFVGRWAQVRLMATAQPAAGLPLYALAILAVTVGVAAGTLRGMDFLLAAPAHRAATPAPLASLRLAAREPRLMIALIMAVLAVGFVLGLFPGIVDAALRAILSSYTFFSSP
jgi:formate hydrogenlyase subunit 3/multisubunit Na+/H+ antiporter MnhD subunit